MDIIGHQMREEEPFKEEKRVFSYYRQLTQIYEETIPLDLESKLYRIDKIMR